MLAGHYKENRAPPAEIHLLSFLLYFLSLCQFLQGKKEFREMGFFSAAKAYRRPKKSITQIYQRRDHVAGKLWLPMMRCSVS